MRESLQQIRPLLLVLFLIFVQLSHFAVAQNVVSVAASPSSIADNSGNSISLTFYLGNSASSGLTVNFQLSGTAQPDINFYVNQVVKFDGPTGIGQVYIPQGDNSAVVLIVPIDNGGVGPNTYLQATLLSASDNSYALGATNTAAMEFINSGSTLSVVTVQVYPIQVDVLTTSSISFVFSRTGDASAPLLIGFEVGGTAIYNEDYTSNVYVPGSNLLTFSSGASTATISFGVEKNGVNYQRTLTVSVSNMAEYSVGSQALAVAYLSSPNLPTISMSSSAVTVDQASYNQEVVVTFTRDSFLDQNLAVEFELSGTLQEGLDYIVTPQFPFYTNNIGIITILGGLYDANLTITFFDTPLSQLGYVNVSLFPQPTEYNTGTPSSVIVNVINSGFTVPTVSVMANTTQAAIGQIIEFTFTRNSSLISPLIVYFEIITNLVLNYDFTFTNNTNNVYGLGFYFGVYHNYNNYNNYGFYGGGGGGVSESTARRYRGVVTIPANNATAPVLLTVTGNPNFQSGVIYSSDLLLYPSLNYSVSVNNYQVLYNVADYPVISVLFNAINITQGNSIQMTVTRSQRDYSRNLTVIIDIYDKNHMIITQTFQNNTVVGVESHSETLSVYFPSGETTELITFRTITNNLIQQFPVTTRIYVQASEEYISSPNSTALTVYGINFCQVVVGTVPDPGFSSGTSFQFTFSQTNDTESQIQVTFGLSGTARLSEDFTLVGGDGVTEINFPTKNQPNVTAVFDFSRGEELSYKYIVFVIRTSGLTNSLTIDLQLNPSRFGYKLNTANSNSQKASISIDGNFPTLFPFSSASPIFSNVVIWISLVSSFTVMLMVFFRGGF